MTKMVCFCVLRNKSIVLAAFYAKRHLLHGKSKNAKADYYIRTFFICESILLNVIVYRMEFHKTRWCDSLNIDQICTQNFGRVCLSKTKHCAALISSQISSRFTKALYYLLYMAPLMFSVSMLSTVRDFRSKWGKW